MSKNISLKDIALKAKVSTAAVSYVLNNQENRVSPEIARRIKAIASQYNYTPNQIAKSLKINKTNTVGLIVAHINYRFTSGITTAIEAEAKKKNYTVLLGSSDESPKKFGALIDVLISRKVDGLIVVPVENSEEQILSLKQKGIPFVMVDRYFPAIETNYVAVDGYKTAYRSALYLLELGHTEIVLFNYKTTEFHLRERTRGFLDALKDQNVPAEKIQYIEIHNDTLQEDMSRHMKDVVKSRLGRMALFFATNALAVNGLKYLNKMNLRAPDDVSVMSFDEAEAFDLYSCAITHSRQPLEQMGAIAMNILMELMKDKKVLKRMLLPSSFVPGTSCGEKVAKPDTSKIKRL